MSMMSLEDTLKNIVYFYGFIPGPTTRNTPTLHRLYETLYCVRSHAQGRTLLHKYRGNAIVHVHVVHRIWVQIQRVHELSEETRLVRLTR